MSSQRLEGLVLHVDEHMARARSRLPGCFGVAAFVGIGVWILLTVLGDAAARAGSSLLVWGLCLLLPGLVIKEIFWKMVGIFGIRRHGHPFLSSLGTQIIGFTLTRRVLAPPDVTVRNVRLRDVSGREHHVRIEGELSTGTVNVGDDVVVEGPLVGGSLLFRRGYNRRIRAEMRLR